jgi:hydroxymethylpyrimidine pyrophosphatase-like HAD family hydrolase
MLEAAGTGVAMGNADDAVKARANVVIGDNTTDSIAQYIYPTCCNQAVIETLICAYSHRPG